MDYYNYKNCTKENTIAHYGIWKQERRNKMYLIFIINTKPHKNRSALLRSVDTIETRSLTDQEIHELKQGKGTRSLICWYYLTIEQMIREDQKFNIKTPLKFINVCLNRGYTDSKLIKEEKPIQMSLFK